MCNNALDPCTATKMDPKRYPIAHLLFSSLLENILFRYNVMEFCNEEKLIHNNKIDL